MGNIYDMARRDARRFATDPNGATVAVALSKPDGTGTINLNCSASGLFINFDNDGNTVNSRKHHVTFIENVLLEADYVVRNGEGNVALRDHLVAYLDNTGTLRHFVVIEAYPNDTLGMVVCMLGKAD